MATTGSSLRGDCLILTALVQRFMDNNNLFHTYESCLKSGKICTEKMLEHGLTTTAQPLEPDHRVRVVPSAPKNTVKQTSAPQTSRRTPLPKTTQGQNWKQKTDQRGRFSTLSAMDRVSTQSIGNIKVLADGRLVPEKNNKMAQNIRNMTAAQVSAHRFLRLVQQKVPHIVAQCPDHLRVDPLDPSAVKWLEPVVPADLAAQYEVEKQLQDQEFTSSTTSPLIVDLTSPSPTSSDSTDMEIEVSPCMALMAKPTAKRTLSLSGEVCGKDKFMRVDDTEKASNQASSSGAP